MDALYAADRRHYFDWRVVVEGNDGRGIDVAVMSKLPISVRTHAHRTFQELGVWNEELRGYRDRAGGRDRRLSPSDRVFMRDCLEIDLKVQGRPLTIYTTHLKSMHPNREWTRPYRRAEALAIKKIIAERFGAHAGDAQLDHLRRHERLCRDRRAAGGRREGQAHRAQRARCADAGRIFRERRAPPRAGG
jgi:hypothetical protein